MSQPVLADDWKTYAGTGCQTNKSHVYYDEFGGICNTSNSSDLYIRCPIVRDRPKNGFPKAVRISGRTGNSLSPLSCTLRNMKQTGVALNDGLGMAGFYVNLPVIAADPFNFSSIRSVTKSISNSIGSHNYGAHLLVCKLPESNLQHSVGGEFIDSCLYNYSIEERL
ncbi:MAG: hypothetical protein K0U40_04000 [Betaproteobacteria bacterium]|nr:hypothetical protein [Betaproteobacteria bacterium]